MLADRFERRLIIFAGKGGVGKTSLSAAVGLAHAKRGRRTLLVELGGTEQIPPLFGRPDPSGYTPARLSAKLPLWSCRVTPKEALAEYGVMKLKFKRLYKMVFENQFMSRLLDWVPGMTELLLMGKIWFLEQERDRLGRPAWDRIVIDAPATGHGVSLLALPQVILEAVQSGPLAADTRPIRQMLVDSTRTVVHLVCLPEELPVRETLDLAARIRGDLRLKIGSCFMNKVWPEALEGTQERAFDAFRRAARGRDPDLDGLLARVQSVRRRQAVQRHHIKLLHEGLRDTPLVEVPILFRGKIGPRELDILSHHMGREPQA